MGRERFQQHPCIGETADAREAARSDVMTELLTGDTDVLRPDACVECEVALEEEKDAKKENDRQYLPMCKNQLEHEGGAHWCTLPIGHEGPHEPRPDLSSMKRPRAPPKRLENEEFMPGRKKVLRRDAAEAGFSAEPPLKPAASSRGRSSPMRSSQHAEPSGYLTMEQTETRKQFGRDQLAELQLKLPEEMRENGWLVVPKGQNALEKGHYNYVFQPEEEEDEVVTEYSNGGVQVGPGGVKRYPYFTSATTAEAWWRLLQQRQAEGENDQGGSSGSVSADDGTLPHAAVPPPFSSGGGPSWLEKGSMVEVKMEEEGLHESRYLAQILDVRDDQAFVEFPAFYAEEDDEENAGGNSEAAVEGEENKKLLTDWVALSQLWPPPPPPPPDFFERLSIDEPLEVYHEEGWWEVSLLRSRTAPNGGLSFQVRSALYGTERWATPDRLRPRWRFVVDPSGSEYWEAEAPAGLRVWEHHTFGRPDSVEGDAHGGGGAEAGDGDEDVVDVEEGIGANGAMPAMPLDAASMSAEELRAQLEMMHQLAHEYRNRIIEVRSAAARIFPLAHSAVVTAGGTLEQPECLTRPIPPLPPLAGLEDSG